MLRCKIDDLAYITKGTNVGRLVDILPLPSPHGYGWWAVRVVGPAVLASYDTAVKNTHTGSVEDHRLRPIRDNNGTDEMLALTKRLSRGR
ncbi:MAG: hypothetical protein ACKVOT_11185 [Polaromonas sp.]